IAEWWSSWSGRRGDDAARKAADSSNRRVVVCVPMSGHVPERRMGGADRRRVARGGRRPGDVQGFAPLILVADDDLDTSARCEAILAGLRFAVAPARTSEEALRVMHAL